MQRRVFHRQQARSSGMEPAATCGLITPGPWRRVRLGSGLSARNVRGRVRRLTRSISVEDLRPIGRQNAGSAVSNSTAAPGLASVPLGPPLCPSHLHPAHLALTDLLPGEATLPLLTSFSCHFLLWMKCLPRGWASGFLNLGVALKVWGLHCPWHKLGPVGSRRWEGAEKIPTLAPSLHGCSEGWLRRHMGPNQAQGAPGPPQLTLSPAPPVAWDSISFMKCSHVIHAPGSVF